MRMIREKYINSDKKMYVYNIDEPLMKFCEKVCNYSKLKIAKFEIKIEGEVMRPSVLINCNSKNDFQKQLSERNDVMFCQFTGVHNNSNEVKLIVDYSDKEVRIVCPYDFHEYNTLINQIINS